MMVVGRDGGLGEAEAHLTIMSACARLADARERRAIELLLDNAPVSEMAAEWGVSVAEARDVVQRAQRNLRAVIRGE